MTTSASLLPTTDIRAVFEKARKLKGLSLDEAALLMDITEPADREALFETACTVKQIIYGQRLVLFAPLYISNLCSNECLYCAFRKSNRAVKRRFLSQAEIAQEVKLLVDQGHKRLLLVSGESYPAEGLDYILRSIDTAYAVKSGKGEIRRINVNIAPLSTAEFKRLKEARIGTYQLFQETYHRPTYAQVHLEGAKRDFDWRYQAPLRAMEAGINDVGMGVLFGLYDWKEEVKSLLTHIRELEKTFGVGPHTISVPRLEPADGSPLSLESPYRMSDSDFLKLVAILRLAVPYTGIIMSTRETPEIRRKCLSLGVSQISAGSRTNPGGYTEGGTDKDGSQFSLGDHRSLDDVIRDCTEMGYVPSFCTGCYRLGRTGKDFMDLAKPGDIRRHCDPNALSTFTEYLMDYASEATRIAGETLIRKTLDKRDSSERVQNERMVQRVRDGERDVYC
ncbi:MAG: [FeFe] hydrogenase H-cluster radical SAM maturase HydG [Elusimicrobia bacterium RIFOXYB2_FULL_49_7]|nr:MAG: [FeFe] hydrogenase H-cluster radical SAM maturase HydG [Elusimicrobia bacterium RIFOXYB2_FULL_49_7]